MLKICSYGFFFLIMEIISIATFSTAIIWGTYIVDVRVLTWGGEP